MTLLLVFYTLIYTFSLVLIVLDFINISISQYLWSVTSLITLLFLYVTAYITIGQPEIFSQIEEMENALGNSERKNEGDNAKAEKELLKRLMDHMENAKSYRDNKITLPKLAKEVAMTPLKLSSVISSYNNHNFYSFVNSYRVKDVMILLRDINRIEQTILELAYEAGFNSKSNFNEIFKKEVGMTPSQFRKK
jgi:AraC-like DNA-binding protein